MAALSGNTRRAYALAGEDFEACTGASVSTATPATARDWIEQMRRRGLRVNSIRQRISALNSLTGLGLELPPREKLQALPLDAQGAAALLKQAQKSPLERALLLALLLCGKRARTWAWRDALDVYMRTALPLALWAALTGLAAARGWSLFPAQAMRPEHYAGGVPLEEAAFASGKGGAALGPGEVTRRLRRLGRRAGLGEVSLRRWLATGRTLMESHDNDAWAVCAALGPAEQARGTRKWTDLRSHRLQRIMRGASR